MDVSEHNWPARVSVDGCENTNTERFEGQRTRKFRIWPMQQIADKIKPHSDCSAILQIHD